MADETPRTDAATVLTCPSAHFAEGDGEPMVPMETARQLERELSTATAALAERIALEKAAYEVLSQERDELRSEVAELEKDAARYRWLREQTEAPVLDARAFVEIDDSAAIDSGDELDAAIDAAMEGESKHG